MRKNMGIMAFLFLLGLLAGCVIFDRNKISGPVFSEGQSAVLTDNLLFELPGLTINVTVLNRRSTFSLVGPVMLPPFIPIFFMDKPDTSLEIVFSFYPKENQSSSEIGEEEVIAENIETFYSFEPMRVVLIDQDGTTVLSDGVFMPKNVGFSPYFCEFNNKMEKSPRLVPIIGNSCFKIHFNRDSDFKDPFTLEIEGIRLSGKPVRFQDIRFKETTLWEQIALP